MFVEPEFYVTPLIGQILLDVIASIISSLLLSFSLGFSSGIRKMIPWDGCKAKQWAASLQSINE